MLDEGMMIDEEMIALTEEAQARIAVHFRSCEVCQKIIRAGFSDDAQCASMCRQECRAAAALDSEFRG